MKEIVMEIVSVSMVKAKLIEKTSIPLHASFKMFVKLLTDVNGLYILWVMAEMAYNFYNISAGCPMQIDFNLKHCRLHVFLPYPVKEPVHQYVYILTQQGISMNLLNQ